MNVNSHRASLNEIFFGLFSLMDARHLQEAREAQTIHSK